MVNILTKTPSSFVLEIASFLNTPPRRMAALLAASIMAALMMGGTATIAYASIQGTTQIMGKDAAPSVVAAEHIQALVADADASALNAV